VKIRDLLFYAAAAAIGLFGLLMVLGASLNMAEPDEQLGNAALGVGLGILPIAFAVWLVRWTRRSSTRQRREALERHVLHLASQSDGRLTPSQVAQATSLTLEESKAFLDQLNVYGYCQMDLADDGRITYTFSA
ncbi:MAG: hypothetical protein AAFY88_13365, partial [Acidobacteriota bacterium]